MFPSRLRLHDGKLIKDRRYHLRTYPNCFVAKELTDWLIDHKEAPDRETGIRLMQKLMDHYIIHHGVWVSDVSDISDHGSCDAIYLITISVHQDMEAWPGHIHDPSIG